MEKELIKVGNKQYVEVKKRKAGRPKVKLDYDLIKKLGMIHCTIEEIATVCSVNKVTLGRDRKFKVIYEQGMNEGKSSLRKALWQSAVEEKNVSNMQFLAKNELGMADKSEVKQTGDIKIIIGKDTEELCK